MFHHLQATRTTSNNPRYMTRSRYDPPSIPSAFQSNRSIQLNKNHSDTQPTSSRYYDPFNYSFFPSSVTNILIQIIIQNFRNPILTQEHKIHSQIHNQ